MSDMRNVPLDGSPQAAQAAVLAIQRYQSLYALHEELTEPARMVALEAAREENSSSPDRAPRRR